MKIIFKGEFKSLKSFESEELEPFTVITGKNGSGKSQLVELLGSKSGSSLNSNLSIEIQPPFKNIQIGGIENDIERDVDFRRWSDDIHYHHFKIDQYGENTKKFLEILVRNNTWFDNPDLISLTKSLRGFSEQQIKDLILKFIEENVSSIFKSRTLEEQIEISKEQLKKFDENTRKIFELAVYVADYKNKKLAELNENDYNNIPIPEHLLERMSMAEIQLGKTFFNYAKRRDYNNRQYFEKKEYGDINAAVSDIEFVKSFPPPWDIINNILELNKISFKFKGIDRKEFTYNIRYSLLITKTTSGKSVDLRDLSSGEKIIIGLIARLFSSDYYQEQIKFPELVVLDEPDAYLHPEMSKLLIDVLLGTFVKKLGIKVIMITHSPTTIALCPDNSIYQLNNDTETTLKRIDKDEALKLLTGLIPTLSIDYKNHKQVFVESPTDVEYYQTIFNKLHQERNFPFKLYFISNSMGKGNSDLVRKIVSNIRESGNNTSFGIIDWDLKNNPDRFLKVHGHNCRYSIENFIYDPIYLSILFIEKKAHNILKDLMIESTINQYLIGNNSNEFLQKIVDWFFENYYKKFRTEAKNHDLKIQVEYLNCKSVSIPKWYLEYQGHDLEVKLKQAFNVIEGYRNEGQLQKELITLIAKCYPFIPKDSVSVIEEIVNFDN